MTAKDYHVHLATSGTNREDGARRDHPATR